MGSSPATTTSGTPLGTGQAARWNAGEEHTFWAVQETVAAIVQYAVEPGTAKGPIT